MGHVVLLGDSIFDNASYVSGGDCVATQVRARFIGDWKVTLLAMDGSVSRDVHRQLLRLPPDASHLVISAGGNDALQCSHLISSPAPDSESCLNDLLDAVSRFQVSYSQMISAVRKLQLPAVVCTIYDAIPGLQPLERMALSLFNDIIIRQASTVRFPVIDLRRVCIENRDYSALSPIEPSEVGGAKISSAIQSVIAGYDFRTDLSAIFP